MPNQALKSISPVDGRYQSKTNELSDFFSEYALIRYRILIEVEYLITLSRLGLEKIPHIDEDQAANLRSVYEEFEWEDAVRVKEIEETTNHDVKAVEYFLKEVLEKMNLQALKEFVHFGLTSQDINNTALPLALKEAHQLIISDLIENLLELLVKKAYDWKDIPMLSRTHGQPASPTRLGKEIYVFAERLENQWELIKQLPFSAKFGGAVGNLNAHHIAYRHTDWEKVAGDFVRNSLGLHRQKTTTQIEHYDYLAAYLDGLARINTIFIDFCRDIWTYISLDYFKQELKKGEIGSSTMPHKVNPIDFENAEGNLGLANAIFRHLSSNLPVSRLQRDLTDSTLSRNLGVPLAHSLIAYKSIQKGIAKLQVNHKTLSSDLDQNWMVIAEAIQTILRREHYPEPYEALKNLTRTNQKISKEQLHAFIDGLKIDEQVKSEMKQISPHNYLGIELLK